MVFAYYHQILQDELSYNDPWLGLAVSGQTQGLQDNKIPMIHYGYHKRLQGPHLHPVPFRRQGKFVESGYFFLP